MRPALSVVAICKDEKRNLHRFLGSIGSVADEVVVVDTGSTDGTVEELKRLGFADKGKSTLKLRHFKWRNDFSAARNFALSHATGEWVLWMDLDDLLHKDAPAMINRFKKQTRKDIAIGFQVASETNAPGVYVRFLQIRMFPNIRGLYWSRAVHENLHRSLELKQIALEPIPECVVLHTGYVDPGVTTAKAMRNAKILEGMAEESYERFYQLGDAYFAMNCMDIGTVNYYKSRGLAVTPLQKNSATERIILGRSIMGEIDAAKIELAMLPENSPEWLFWTATFAYAEKEYDRAGPLYEKILEIEYEPQSMNSYLDSYKTRAVEVLEKMESMYQESQKELVNG